jgi:hypothetical protein
MIGESEFLQEKSNPEILEGLLDTLENNNSGEGIDGVIEALYTMLKQSNQAYTRFAPKILGALFSAFISAEGNESRRAKCLFLVYLCLRTFAWADGYDNELVSRCLDDSYSSWMALIVSIFQTSPKANFEIKRNALRVFQ